MNTQHERFIVHLNKQLRELKEMDDTDVNLGTYSILLAAMCDNLQLLRYWNIPFTFTEKDGYSLKEAVHAETM